jgi:hypothetical protein
MPASIAGVRQAVLVFTGPKASIYCLAIDGDDLYWSQDGVFQIMTMKLAGGAPVALATGLCSCMAVDATHVYFTDFDAGLVTKVPRAGEPPWCWPQGKAIRPASASTARLPTGLTSTTGPSTRSLSGVARTR